MLNFLGLDLNSDCRSCDPAKHNFVRGVEEGQLVFAQLMQHLPLTTFRRCVTRYRGAFKVKKFLVPRSISVHGVRPVDLSGEPSRHRSMRARTKFQALYLGIRYHLEYWHHTGRWYSSAWKFVG